MLDVELAAIIGRDTYGESEGGFLVDKMESSRVEPWGKTRPLLLLIGSGSILVGLLLVWTFGQIFGILIFMGAFIVIAGLQRYLHDVGGETQ